MKNHLPLFIALLLASCGLFSQNLVEKIGPEIDNKEAEFFDRIITQNGSAMYILRSNTQGKGINYFLDTYDGASLTKTSSYPLLKMKAYEITGSNLSFIKNAKFHILTKEHNTDQKTVEYSFRIFDIKTGALVKKQMLLTMPTSLETWYSHSMLNKVNADTSKIIFILERKSNNENKRELVFETYDIQTMKKIADKTIEYDYIANEKYTNFQLDGKGNLYFLHYYDYDKKAYAYTKAELVYNNMENKSAVKFPIETSQNMKLSVDYEVSPDTKSLYIFSAIDETKAERTDKSFKNSGLNITKLEPNTLKEIKTKLVLFNDEIIGRLTCHLSKGLPQSNYNPSIYFINNETIFLELSCEWPDEQRHLVIFSLTADMELNWSKFIYRNSKSLNYPISTTKIVSTKGMGFLFLEHNDFDDQGIDMNTVDICSYKAAGGGNLKASKSVIYSLDLSGNLRKYIVYDKKDKGVLPPYGKITSEKFFVRMMDGKKEYIGVVNAKQ